MPVSLSDTYQQTRARAHPDCRLCTEQPATIPTLDFQVTDHGVVRASLSCCHDSQGYAGMVHGGITSAIMDAALTNALFSAGEVGVTARLDLRYRRPLWLGRQIVINAWLIGQRLGGWQLKAETWQDGHCCVVAQALFLPAPGVGAV